MKLFELFNRPVELYQGQLKYEIGQWLFEAGQFGTQLLYTWTF